MPVPDHKGVQMPDQQTVKQTAVSACLPDKGREETAQTKEFYGHLALNHTAKLKATSHAILRPLCFWRHLRLILSKILSEIHVGYDKKSGYRNREAFLL